MAQFSDITEEVPADPARNSENPSSPRGWLSGIVRSNTECSTGNSSLTGDRRDSKKMFSAQIVHDSSPSLSTEDELPLPASYPLPLVVFIFFLAIVSGCVVLGVHYTILYSSCPLGLNGCNSFDGKASKGFFLIRWVKRTLGSDVPEDVVYIVCAVIGALAFTEVLKRLPDGLSHQVQGGGTIQGLVAVAGGERVSIAAAGLRIITTTLYLATAGTMGMDGPSIHVCVGMISGVGWLLGMRGMATQSLLACLGFSCGFAATFNSPLAGILFALEELQHVSSAVSRHVICMILMASVVACSVGRVMKGSTSLFDVSSGKNGGLPEVFGPSMWMLIAVPISIVCSFYGFAISRVLHRCWAFVAIARTKVPTRCVTVFMTAMAACVGAAVFRMSGYRGVWGIGYESLQKAFDVKLQNNNLVEASNFFVFGIGKALAMVMSMAVGCPGDILEPVLLSGGFIGGGIGSLFQEMVQDPTLAPHVLKPCIIFGMVSLFASCFRFPLTPIVMVLEFLGEETYAIVLPTALASFTAILVSNRLFPPLLDVVMHHAGINLDEIREEADATLDEQDEEDVFDVEQAEDASDSESLQSSHASTNASHGSHALAHNGSIGGRIRISIASSMAALASSQERQSSHDHSDHHRADARSHTSHSGSSHNSHTLPGHSHQPGGHTDQDGSKNTSRNSSRAGTNNSVGTLGTIASLGFSSLNWIGAGTPVAPEQPSSRSGSKDQPICVGCTFSLVPQPGLTLKELAGAQSPYASYGSDSKEPIGRQQSSPQSPSASQSTQLYAVQEAVVVGMPALPRALLENATQPQESLQTRPADPASSSSHEVADKPDVDAPSQCGLAAGDAAQQQ